MHAAQQRRELSELVHVQRPAVVLVEAREDFPRARLGKAPQTGHGSARGDRLAEIERARAVRVRALERRLRALRELGGRVLDAHRGGDGVAEVVPERAGQEGGHRLGSRAPRISKPSNATLGEECRSRDSRNDRQTVEGVESGERRVLPTTRRAVVRARARWRWGEPRASLSGDRKGDVSVDAREDTPPTTRYTSRSRQNLSKCPRDRLRRDSVFFLRRRSPATSLRGSRARTAVGARCLPSA